MAKAEVEGGQGEGAVLDLYLQLEEARDYMYPVSLRLGVSLGA